MNKQQKLEIIWTAISECPECWELQDDDTYDIANYVVNAIDKAGLLLKKRSSKRRRVEPKQGQSNVRKADVARREKRRKE